MVEKGRKRLKKPRVSVTGGKEETCYGVKRYGWENGYFIDR